MENTNINIKALRKAKNLTQKQFAELMDSGQSYVSCVENGTEKIPEIWISKIKEKLDIENPASEFPLEVSEMLDTQAELFEIIHEKDKQIERLQNQSRILISIIESLTKEESK